MELLLLPQPLVLLYLFAPCTLWLVCSTTGGPASCSRWNGNDASRCRCRTTRTLGRGKVLPPETRAPHEGESGYGHAGQHQQPREKRCAVPIRHEVSIAAGGDGTGKVCSFKTSNTTGPAERIYLLSCNLALVACVCRFAAIVAESWSVAQPPPALYRFRGERVLRRGARRRGQSGRRGGSPQGTPTCCPRVPWIGWFGVVVAARYQPTRTSESLSVSRTYIV